MHKDNPDFIDSKDDYVRIEYDLNEEQLDEVVLTNSFFHLERMNDNTFWIGVKNDTGYYHINIFFRDGKVHSRIERVDD